MFLAQKRQLKNTIFPLMNIFKPLALLFLATAFAVASNPSPQGSSPGGKTTFDYVRGRAYNPYSTVGAATTVTDLVTLPSDISGQKFFYISPTSQLGYTAFNLGGGSFMLGLDSAGGAGAGDLAALVLGYATPSFGLALDYSISKAWVSTKNPKQSTRTTEPGDNIGLYFSMPLGSPILYANASWLTYGPSYSQSEGAKVWDDYSVLRAKAGLTNVSGSFNYDGYLDFIRAGHTRTDTSGNVSIDPNTYLGFALHFDVGYAALKSSVARIIVGTNNHLFMMSFDGYGNIKNGSEMGLVISPNILAEVSMSDNWLAFTGAQHSLNVQAGHRSARDGKTSILQIAHTTGGTEAYAGVRYQKPDWAVEAAIYPDMFDNPLTGLNGNNMFYHFGGFVYF